MYNVSLSTTAFNFKMRCVSVSISSEFMKNLFLRLANYIPQQKIKVLNLKWCYSIIWKYCSILISVRKVKRKCLQHPIWHQLHDKITQLFSKLKTRTQTDLVSSCYKKKRTLYQHSNLMRAKQNKYIIVVCSSSPTKLLMSRKQLEDFYIF